MTDTSEAAPIVEAAEAVAATIATPSIPILAEDLLLVHKLAIEVKAQLAEKGNNLSNLFVWLFNLS